jgi:hypothetical protein
MVNVITVKKNESTHAVHPPHAFGRIQPVVGSLFGHLGLSSRAGASLDTGGGLLGPAPVFDRVGRANRLVGGEEDGANTVVAVVDSCFLSGDQVPRGQVVANGQLGQLLGGQRRDARSCTVADAAA